LKVPCLPAGRDSFVRHKNIRNSFEGSLPAGRQGLLCAAQESIEIVEGSQPAPDQWEG